MFGLFDLAGMRWISIRNYNWSDNPFKDGNLQEMSAGESKCFYWFIFIWVLNRPSHAKGL